MAALRNLSNTELRDRLAAFEAERERTTPGMHEVECDAWAICRDCTCPQGTTQRPVRGIRQTQVVTFGHVDGDWQSPYANVVSHTHTQLRFADPDDATCPTCGLGEAMITDQVTPNYGVMFGGSEALLRVKRAGVAPPVDADALLATADAVKHRPETPAEALLARYIRSEITDAEYAHKLAVLGLPVPAALQDAATSAQEPASAPPGDDPVPTAPKPTAARRPKAA